MTAVNGGGVKIKKHKTKGDRKKEGRGIKMKAFDKRGQGVKIRIQVNEVIRGGGCFRSMTGIKIIAGGGAVMKREG